MIAMAVLQTGRVSLQRLVLAALSLILAISGGAIAVAAPPAERSYVVSLRRLTEREYRNSIADIFGKEIEVRGSFEPTIRSNGLAAVSTASVSVTPVGFESFNKMMLPEGASPVADGRDKTNAASRQMARSRDFRDSARPLRRAPRRRIRHFAPREPRRPRFRR